ncbi:hypothetical protein QG083_04190 [Kingella kingae]|uniref:hypothetical protein n=1 Tax=Kingella kingae TaxID=504 RepID=UPI0002D6B66C|nr:hypothetical protein [Kingella kingae]MBD3614196.1 hypothetical protein [Kingella kingae]MBD3632481.1 hypothetical protein [Kingella kingae]MBD3659874.1 hypothetical protein [Kingella kingae]MDK4544586.1 hypothetical protein [Kingella kingae]MDK4566372.1 hypothetical protein [Kingella kingae]
MKTKNHSWLAQWCWHWGIHQHTPAMLYRPINVRLCNRQTFIKPPSHALNG